jgi:hypothetical protein
VEVDLPDDAPQDASILPPGARVYASSSQAVKRKYKFPRPKAGAFRRRRPVDVTVRVFATGIEAEGKAGSGAVAAVKWEGGLPPARDAESTVAAARKSFERSGDTPFSLAAFVLKNPGSRFVAASQWNDIRRRLYAALADADDARRGRERASVLEWTLRGPPDDDEAIVADALRIANLEGRDVPMLPPDFFARQARLRLRLREPARRWSILTDRVAHLGAFEREDWRDVDEVIVGALDDSRETLSAALDRLAAAAGRETVRLWLPAVLRGWRGEEADARIGRLMDAGWRKWLVSGLGGWRRVSLAGAADVACDWPLYTMNRWAAAAWDWMGASRFTFSPEDGHANLSRLLPLYGSRAWVIAYGDVPWFWSASCARRNLGVDCGKGKECGAAPMRLVSASGETVWAIPDRCGTVAVGEKPFSLARRLAELEGMGARCFRADFAWLDYTPDEVRGIWRALRHGEAVSGREGNYVRGLA